MTSLQDQADSVRSAVASISTCSPATAVLLKDLILPSDALSSARTDGTESRASKTGRAPKTTASGRAPGKKSTKAATTAGLSAKEKAVLATHVINASLKALGEAAKPTAAPAAPRPTQPEAGDLARKASRNALRRSLSAPPTPLQARTLNRVATSPLATAKQPTRPASSGAGSSSCLSLVECARIAFAALRGLHNAGDVILPELQLESGMSSLVARLIALGMLEQAAKELRLLKQRLDSHSGVLSTAAKKPAKASAQSDTASAARISDILDFRGFKAADGPVTNLVITTQLQALRVLSMMKKPQQTESVVDMLKDSTTSSPLRLLIAYAGSSATNRDKASRQLETLSQLLLSLTPSVSSKCDDEALEPKLSISPSAAFDLQILGLESRLQWWAIAGHKGDVDKDILSPFSRCLAAYIRRAGSRDESLYNKCVDAFEHIQGLVKHNSTSPGMSFKSPMASLYQSLGTLAREARRYPEAIAWTKHAKGLLKEGTDSEASRCSIDALLLSLQLKNPLEYLEDDKLVEAVIDGIQGVLKGDSTELEDLLANVGLARRSAMNILVAQDKSVLAAEHTMPLLESFVIQCPRFCLRWLGKPPASNGSTKDFLRYEQRRQILTKSIHLFLDSAFMVNKTLIDEQRVSWTQMDSVLGDCLTLLDYMGDSGSAESSSTSHHVKISHFYFMQYTLLRQSCKDPKSPEPMRALRRSIECVKQRSAREKEKSQLIMKLERLAEAYKSLGRVGEALGALQSIRSSLVDDGVLAEIVQCLEERPPVFAWTRTSQASTLSRTLVSIAKLEQVPMDWSVDLPEPQQLAVREHWLHFIMLGGFKDRKRPTLADECVESLLKTYYPTRFPIKRLRTLLSLLTVNLDDQEQFAAIESQVDAVVGLIKGGGCAEDTPLEPYLQHYYAYHSSLVGLKSAAPDLGRIESALFQWHRAIKDCNRLEDLDRAIDNPAALLSHLQSLADLGRTLGNDSVQLTALELASMISTMSAKWSPEDRIASYSALALVYANTGRCAMAEKVLDCCQKVILSESGPVPREAVADMHLAYADYYIMTGDLDKAETHFNQARTHAVSGGADGPQPSRTRRRDLISYASLVQSMIASKKGEAHHALVHARETVRVLFSDWSRLEDMSKAQQNASGAPDLSTGDSSSPPASTAVVPAGPEYWKLFHSLFRSMSHLSSVYAHLGMFQETVYYAEQAQKMAQSTNARLYLAQCEAWLASVHFKAGKLDKSLELANLSSSRFQDGDRTCTAVTLACQLGGLYRDLKEFDLEQDMIGRAEAAMKFLHQTSVSADNEDSQEASATAKPAPEDKPKNQPAKRAPGAASTARKATTRKAVTTSKAKAPAPAVETAAPTTSDIIISSLETLLMMHRAISLVNSRDWTAAMKLLQQSQVLTKLGKSKLGEMVARATCFFGQCQEQMMRDTVFSVIQDSTLSFPAVCSASSQAVADRLALVKASPPKKGRAAAGAASAARLPDFLENLQAAHDCLVQAHAVAMVSGDGAMVHRIAGMLQSTMLLLSAACPSRPRVTGNQSFATCSVEAAQNLTWRRERKALLLEMSGYKSDGLEWPMIVDQVDSASSPARTGAPAADMGRFQKEYIDIIPKDWTVISVSLSDNKHDLCISRLQAGHSPFVIRLPLERGSSRDSANDSFNYHQGRAELLEIIRLADESAHRARDMSRKRAKTVWWAEREALDKRLGAAPSCSARFQKSFHDILDKHLPSRRQVRGRRTKAAAATPAPVKVTLDPRILELFVGLGDVTDPDCGDLDDALNDLLYFVVDILQFHGERNAYDEIDFDSMCVETFDALHSYHTTAAEKEKKNGAKKSSGSRREPQQQQHTVLVLDKALHVFPWESIPCMQGRIYHIDRFAEYERAGTLWDVTDRDIDRLAGRALEEWGLVEPGTFPVEDRAKITSGGGTCTAAGKTLSSSSSSARSLVQAVATAREVCRFRYLTAAAVCVYGIPVYLTDDETTTTTTTTA
ncbi:separin [Magnaporthiopsis poae ATCC 64411]|uniref:Separin n=1 Tax=Magnaporthiopsis poae (strain ATCC 64411 / 73-15) TaxID=644358 RepID=A0A0C4DTK2_MAGP6|nr:separin [Magnaporthiopsis poae ATCC 64411]